MVITLLENRAGTRMLNHNIHQSRAWPRGIDLEGHEMVITLLENRAGTRIMNHNIHQSRAWSRGIHRPLCH